MAIFGAPVEDLNHAQNSVMAAIEIERVKYILSFGNFEVPLIARIGINSGEIVAGNIGSERRMDYTAIGDNVNLAARLEGVNKVYGSNIIISESTYERVKSLVICYELDIIKVKGKDNAVKIYIPFKFLSDIVIDDKEFYKIYCGCS